MSLSANAEALLYKCAQSVVNGTRVELDFSNLHRDFHDEREEIPNFLARMVEQLSNFKQTVRTADVNLFANRVMGPCQYLVVCPYNTPSGKVMDLSPDMKLASLGPYRNGFDCPEKPASPELVQTERERAAAYARQDALRTLAKQDVESFISSVVNALRVALASSGNRELSLDVESALRLTPNLSLEAVATYCREHGTDLRTIAKIASA